MGTRYAGTDTISHIFEVGLDMIKTVPITASMRMGTLNNQPYGASKTEITEKVHMKVSANIFALRGMAPVSRNPATPLPNIRLPTTNLYSLSEDLRNRVAAIMSQIVPGSPGNT